MTGPTSDTGINYESNYFMIRKPNATQIGVYKASGLTLTDYNKFYFKLGSTSECSINDGQLTVNMASPIQTITSAQFQGAEPTNGLAFTRFGSTAIPILKSLKIWNASNVLVADMVSAIDDTGASCMWCRVRNTFIPLIASSSSTSYSLRPTEETSLIHQIIEEYSLEG